MCAVLFVLINVCQFLISLYSTHLGTFIYIGDTKGGEE